MKNIAITFGGVSPEHEVSIITGLQVIENIDKSKYQVTPVFIDQVGNFFLMKDLRTRRDYLKTRKMPTYFFRKQDQAFLKSGLFKKTKIDMVYNCCHGGVGEAGSLAGFFETLNLPVTSTNIESSVICMNKSLSKYLVERQNIPTVPSLTLSYKEIRENINNVTEKIIHELELPVILKPVHFGSSIGIKIATTKVALEISLNEISFLDSEILIEKFLSPIKEYNCSVKIKQGKVQTSAIEKPFTKSEILSFKDKYEEGGTKKIGGMASLDREIPAKISVVDGELIRKYSEKIYSTLSCFGVVRIDFLMDREGKIYFNEINPIPGSMSFYLWEANGITFKEQITDLIEETLNQEKKIVFKNKTDIVEKFTS